MVLSAVPLVRLPRHQAPILLPSTSKGLAGQPVNACGPLFRNDASNASRVVINSLAANVRSTRQRRRMTQEQLAEKAELSTVHVQQVEYGTTVASVITLAALADALNVEVDSLLRPARPPVKAQPGRPRGMRSKR